MGKGESWHSEYASQLSRKISDPRVDAVVESAKSRRESRRSDTSDDGRPRSASTSSKYFIRQNSTSSLDSPSNRSVLSDNPRPLTSRPKLVRKKAFLGKIDQKMLSSPKISPRPVNKENNISTPKIIKKNSTYSLLQEESPKIEEIRPNSAPSVVSRNRSTFQSQPGSVKSNSKNNDKVDTVRRTSSSKSLAGTKTKDKNEFKTETLNKTFDFNPQAYIGPNAFFSFGYSAKKPTMGLAPRNLDPFGTGKAERSKLVCYTILFINTIFISILRMVLLIRIIHIKWKKVNHGILNMLHN